MGFDENREDNEWNVSAIIKDEEMSIIIQKKCQTLAHFSHPISTTGFELVSLL